MFFLSLKAEIFSDFHFTKFFLINAPKNVIVMMTLIVPLKNVKSTPFYIK